MNKDRKVSTVKSTLGYVHPHRWLGMDNCGWKYKNVCGRMKTVRYAFEGYGGEKGDFGKSLSATDCHKLPDTARFFKNDTTLECLYLLCSRKHLKTSKGMNKGRKVSTVKSTLGYAHPHRWMEINICGRINKNECWRIGMMRYAFRGRPP